MRLTVVNTANTTQLQDVIIQKFKFQTAKGKFYEGGERQLLFNASVT